MINGLNVEAKAIHKTLEKLHKFIFTSVSVEDQRSLDDASTNKEELKTLKRYLEPTNEARRVEMIIKYRSLKYNKSEKVEIFIQRWEKIYRDAVNAKIPDVNDNSPHHDFHRAIADIDPFCSTSKAGHFKRLSSKNKIPRTVYELIQDFRHHRGIFEADKLKAPNRGAFASFK
jgi:hypothetical protein